MNAIIAMNGSEQFHNGCQYYVRPCSLTYPQPGIGSISTGKCTGDCPTRTRPGNGGSLEIVSSALLHT
jgi:hypothetical protein